LHDRHLFRYSKGNSNLEYVRTKQFLERRPFYWAIKTFKSQPNKIININSSRKFKLKLKISLINNVIYNVNEFIRHQKLSTLRALLCYEISFLYLIKECVLSLFWTFSPDIMFGVEVGVGESIENAPLV
jgi:hypothetical protein